MDIPVVSKPRVVGIIPARFQSSRLPGKPLLKIGDKSMIAWVYERASQCVELNHVCIATDDERIFNEAKRFDADVVMTRTDHKSGTERCAEALEKLPDHNHFDIVVNIQGDEPFIHPEQISELIQVIKRRHAQIATLVRGIESEELMNNLNTVKAVLEANGRVSQFSREAPDSSQKNIYQHIGLYAFKTKILKEIVKLSPSPNEMKASLEQLRWTDNGYDIYAAVSEYPNVSVDTPEDLERARQRAKEF